MLENYLKEGQVRVGWLYPGEVEKERGIPATLVRENNRIHLLVQVKSRKDSSPATRWGMNNSHFGDDPRGEKYQYDAPENMYFVDDVGRTLLIGCKPFGFRDSLLSSSAGIGGVLNKLSVDTAIFSTNICNTDTFNGYKTEIESLSQWLQISELISEREFYEDELMLRVKSVLIKAFSNDEEVMIDDSIGLKFRSGFNVKYNDSQTQITYKLADNLETYHQDGISFNEAMKIHSAVRDLLMISSWSNHQFTSISVSHDRDKEFDNKNFNVEIITKNNNSVLFNTNNIVDKKYNINNKKYSVDYIKTKISTFSKDLITFDELAGTIETDLNKGRDLGNKVNSFNEVKERITSDITFFKSLSSENTEYDKLNELTSRLSRIEKLTPGIINAVNSSIASKNGSAIASAFLIINDIDRLARELANI